MDMLKKSGLLALSKHIRNSSESKTLKRGIKSSERFEKRTKITLPKQKLNRISGVIATDLSEVNESSKKKNFRGPLFI